MTDRVARVVAPNASRASHTRRGFLNHWPSTFARAELRDSLTTSDVVIDVSELPAKLRPGEGTYVSKTISRRWSRLAVRAGALAVAIGMATGLSGVAQAAPSPVQPYVSCYWPNSDGSITADIGYNNSSATTQTYPIGSLNFVSPAPQDRGQPTVFLPGGHDNVWAPTVSAADLSAGADWTLNGVKLSTSVGGVPQCATKPVPITGGAGGFITFAIAAVAIGALVFSRRRFHGLGAWLDARRALRQ